MDVGSLGSAANLATIKELTGLGQAQAASDSGMAVMQKVLEVQEVVASQLLEMMGVGGNLDIRV